MSAPLKPWARFYWVEQEDQACELCGEVIPKGTRAMYSIALGERGEAKWKYIYRCWRCTRKAEGQE